MLKKHVKIATCYPVGTDLATATARCKDTGAVRAVSFFIRENIPHSACSKIRILNEQEFQAL
jgi:hypothetical protein